MRVQLTDRQHLVVEIYLYRSVVIPGMSSVSGERCFRTPDTGHSTFNALTPLESEIRIPTTDRPFHTLLIVNPSSV